MEAADPGYLEDYAAATMIDEQIVAAMGSIPQSWIVGGTYPVGDPTWNTGWYTYSTSTTAGQYYYPMTTSSGTVTVTCSGGGGGGCTTNGTCVGGSGGNSSMMYPGSTNGTFYVPYDQTWGVAEEPEPLTEEQATREWLRAESRWRDAERQLQRQAAKAKAEALLLSLLPEPEQQRYTHHGYFEVIGSHGGRYRVRRGVAQEPSKNSASRPSQPACETGPRAGTTQRSKHVCPPERPGQRD